MWKSILLLVCLSGFCCASPLGFKKNMPIMQREEQPMIMEPAASQEVESEAEQPAVVAAMSTLTLPSNATSIRADITDGFSCENKTYGYYADVENECQIFHVCLPVTYADGKENTFRWSFICPEETIFSQDSFTCMRREDMNIDCEESFKYYELNRNFGMIEEEPQKISTNNNHNNNNNMKPMASEDQESAMTMQTAQQVQPNMVEEEVVKEMSPAPVPMPTLTQPMKEKPMKIQKPNRRKPSVSHTTHTAYNKLPANFPLRKMPQATPVTLEATTVQPVASEATAEDEVKPVVQRFTKRPVSMSTALKEKIQPVKTETTPIRVELYSQKRKRPTYFNKKPIEEPTINAVAQPDLTEPEPAVKLESMFTPATQQSTQEGTQIIEEVNGNAESTLKVESSNKLESELPIANIASTTIDAEPQSSETAAVYVKPEETVKTLPETHIAVEEPQHVQETIATEEQFTEKLAEPRPIEAELINAPALEESLKVEETQLPLEAIEEIPAVIVEVEEHQATNSNKKLNTEEGTSNTVEELKTPEMTEEIKPVDEEPLKTAEKIDIPVETPAIFELNSEEENLTPTLAELEDEKPSNAVEIMPASPEMQVHNPMVEQMFEEIDAHKQSMGGFKPVDPAMAAEAEALITDFLHTLMKSDKTNQKPIMPMDMAENIEAAATENQEVKAETAEALKEESQEIKTETKVETEEAEKMENENESNKMENIESVKADSLETEKENEIKSIKAENEEKETVPEIEIASQTEEHQIAVEEPAEATQVIAELLKNTAQEAEEEKEEEAQPQILKNAAPISMMMMNHFPSEMYQIPVQIIQTPAEEMPTVEQSQEKTESEQPKETAVETETSEMSGYKALSIDDIVELVKERLDQAPTADAEKANEIFPIEMAEASEEKAAIVKNINENNLLEEKPAEEHSAEHIVMPIYHRVNEIDSNMVKSHNLLVNEPEQVLIEEEKHVEAHTVEDVKTEEKSVQTDEAVDGEAAVKTETEPAQAQQVATETETLEAKTKSGRVYRSRSMKNAKMDPRKRRFLFRSDAS